MPIFLLAEFNYVFCVQWPLPSGLASTIRIVSCEHTRLPAHTCLAANGPEGEVKTFCEACLAGLGARGTSTRRCLDNTDCGFKSATLLWCCDFILTIVTLKSPPPPPGEAKTK